MMPARRVALVTGAGRGIGAAIAARLARAGAAVIVAARGARAGEEVARELRAGGATAWPLVLDVADPASISAAAGAASDIASDVGPVEWLVNNAGIAESARFLDRASAADDPFAKHMRVNFDGPRLLTEAFAPAMIERGYGRIVNVASSAGLRGYAYAAAYSASKHALVGYSLSAALELAKSGVTVNLVCPHFVESPMTEASIALIVSKTGRSAAEARALLAAQNPGGTLVPPAEVADVVLELCEGERNGAIAELVGGKGPREKTVLWRETRAS